MNRVLLVSSHFPPDRSAGTHRVVRFANYLQELGWAVSVLTIDPACYRRSIPRDPALIDGLDPRLTIYRTAARRGITTLVNWRNRFFRSPAHPPTSPDSGPRHPRTAQGWKARRSQLMASLFAFPDDEIGWFPDALIQGLRIVRREHIDVVLTSAPPFTCHLVGAALKTMCAVQWIADFRDPWSRAPWGKHGSAAAHRRLEARVVHGADTLLLNTPELLAEFANWYGQGVSRKFHVVANGYDAQLERYADHTTAPAPPVIVTHAGNLYGDRDPMPLILGLAEAIRDGLVPRHGLRVNFVGKIAAQADLESAIGRLGLAGIVTCRPPVPHHEALRVLAASHVLLVIQPGTSLQVPAKMYEYVGLRRTILALAEEGGVARIARDSGLGLVVGPHDVGGIAKALARVYEGHVGAGVMAPDLARVKRYDARLQSDVLGAIMSRLPLPPHTHLSTALDNAGRLKTS